VAIFVYNNLVGGQDELVFDGNSLVVTEKGIVIAKGRQFEEDLVIADLDVESVFRTRLHDPRWRKERQLRKAIVEPGATIQVASCIHQNEKLPVPEREIPVRSPHGEVYDALVLGTRDYVHKNGFEKVLIGLSGGIDSSLVAAIAVDALGKDNVIGVAMPSRYSSSSSLDDARKLADNLGLKMFIIPFEKIFASYLEVLDESFKGMAPGIAEENLQARIRGNLLMALSNKFGWLVLTTGNKSEMATGYTTLYGDMAGGFAVIKDVLKTMVYELAQYRNQKDAVKCIPVSIIEKPPSAELRPEQKDSDTLPPYEILDKILTEYVEEDKSVDQIIEMGIDSDLVKKAARLVDMSEYKRRQSPPGIKITPRAFGRDRRLPITNKYRGL
jgi:NAD+ synthase (glutamine-hydrolysing)